MPPSSAVPLAPAESSGGIEGLLRELLAEQRQHGGAPIHLLCCLAVYTGQRKGAITALRRQDVDFAAKAIYFRRAQKTKRQIAVPLLPPLESVLAAHMDAMADKKPEAKLVDVADFEKTFSRSVRRAGRVREARAATAIRWDGMLVLLVERGEDD